jgi:[ribosomal protein S18]-alanine N-acetyltransferase
MIGIRLMSVQDLDQVLAVERSTLEAPHWDRSAYANLLLTDARGVRYGAFVAMDGSELAGFIVARQVLEVCEIESIAVAEGARRQGVGTVLLQETLRWAAAGGTERVQLEVRAGNSKAISFYERAGLFKEGLRRGYYSDPEEDAVLMGKSLYSTD